jgi:predicted nucleotidyltransferase
MIDLESSLQEKVKQVVRQYVPGSEIRVFGSRYKGTARKFSDLDLAICGQEKIHWSKLADIREEFINSDLPIRVDVLDYQAVSDQMQKIIDQGYEIM